MKSFEYSGSKKYSGSLLFEQYLSIHNSPKCKRRRYDLKKYS